MEVIFDPRVPVQFHYDKRWKKILVWFEFKVKPDRVTYSAYKLPDGQIIMHPRYKEKLLLTLE